jgi:hypothetical protein
LETSRVQRRDWFGIDDRGPNNQGGVVRTMIPVKAVACVARLSVVSFMSLIVAMAQTQPAPASIGAAPSSRILPPSSTYVFPSEKYFYSVQWRFFNAGTSTVKIQRSSSGEHVTATADSAGFPDKVFRVHDIFDANIDSRTFCTLQVSKHSEEGPHRRETNVVLNYSRLKGEVDVKDLKSSETRHDEFDIPDCVTDVITGFSYVGSLPLAPGFSQTFPVNDNGRTTDVMIRVEGRERVRGPAGEFQTLRVMAEPLSGPMKGKGVLWAWYTDDARRVPVQMKSKLGFATLLFQLQRIELAGCGK